MSLQSTKTVSVDTSKWDELFESLPGGALIHQGLVDIENGRTTAHALLVMIGGPRLRKLGLPVPHSCDNPEDELYDLLSQHNPDSAHSRYNALIRTLVSFERAAECVRK
jgi:hypothetical protein